MPGQQPGTAQKGMTLLKTALETMQSALPMLPLGSPLHASALKAVADISKQMSKGPDDNSDTIQQLAQIARQSSQGGGNAQMLQRMMPPQGGGAPPPGGMPA